MSERQHLTVFFQLLWAEGRMSGLIMASSHHLYIYNVRATPTHFYLHCCSLRSPFIGE